MPIVVITGAGAGVGRAAVREFSRRGYDVGLIGRNPERLEAAAGEVRTQGMRAQVAIADVADPAAVDSAAAAIEAGLGPIDVWVNNAMATVFSPVARTDPAEIKRGTEVTYLGTVHGTLAALKRMQLRNRGAIINVGSALAYRSIPLQAVYCGAKSAIRGFTDALRTELLHDRSRITVSMVHLPALNTPQFDWALNRTGHRARPVSPVYQPEMAARAIAFTARHPRREVWVGLSTVVAILGNRLFPGLADRYLALAGYQAQLSDQRGPVNAPSNLFEPVTGSFAAHGRFDVRARDTEWEVVTSRHKDAAVAIGVLAAVAGLRALLRRRSR